MVVDIEKDTISDDLSVKLLINSFGIFLNQLFKSWIVILSYMFFGATVGLILTFLIKPIFVADSSFIVETKSNNSTLSNYAGLASQFGINLGNVQGSDLFQSNNITHLMTSRRLIYQTLLSDVHMQGGDSILADRYIDVYSLKSKWSNDPGLRNIIFKAHIEKLNINHYDALGRIYDNMLKNNIIVDKDKKSEIIELKVLTENELFSKLFCEKLITKVGEFYIETKTKKIRTTLNLVQKKADSVKGLLFSGIRGLATFEDQNKNVIRQDAMVGSKIKVIKTNLLQALYTDLSKNLEGTKLELISETPLIQIIDQPILPLEKVKLGKILTAIEGALFGLIISVIYISIKFGNSKTI